VEDLFAEEINTLSKHLEGLQAYRKATELVLDSAKQAEFQEALEKVQLEDASGEYKRLLCHAAWVAEAEQEVAEAVNYDRMEACTAKFNEQLRLQRALVAAGTKAMGALTSATRAYVTDHRQRARAQDRAAERARAVAAKKAAATAKAKGRAAGGPSKGDSFQFFAAREDSAMAVRGSAVAEGEKVDPSLPLKFTNQDWATKLRQSEGGMSSNLNFFEASVNKAVKEKGWARAQAFPKEQIDDVQRELRQLLPGSWFVEVRESDFGDLKSFRHHSGASVTALGGTVAYVGFECPDRGRVIPLLLACRFAGVGRQEPNVRAVGLVSGTGTERWASCAWATPAAARSFASGWKTSWCTWSAPRTPSCASPR
jgi:hypothetical protein